MERLEEAFKRALEDERFRSVILEGLGFGSNSLSAGDVADIIRHVAKEAEGEEAIALIDSPSLAEQAAGFAAVLATALGLERFPVADAARNAFCRELLGWPEGSHDLFWSRWEQSPRQLHRKCAGKDEWKLILWSVTAGWGDFFGADAERKRG